MRWTNEKTMNGKTLASKAKRAMLLDPTALPFDCARWSALIVGLVLMSLWLTRITRAQTETSSPSSLKSDKILPTDNELVSDEKGGADDSSTVGPEKDRQHLNLVHLLLKGGLLMIPIGLMSLLAATFGIERGLALRREKVMPVQLVEELGGLSDSPNGFDPRQAYRVCQRYPSAASTVIRAMLLKVGRPQLEVEQAVKESSEREADRLYTNVRWLSLATAVTPLMGLLGTVWGMIQAFFDTTQLMPGQNKTNFLAEGIYVALVTTLGGLVVAIPAAMLAHYFEGRIQMLFHEINEMLFNIMPQIERYEGRLRISKKRLPEKTDKNDDRSTDEATVGSTTSDPQSTPQ